MPLRVAASGDRIGSVGFDFAPGRRKDIDGHASHGERAMKLVAMFDPDRLKLDLSDPRPDKGDAETVQASP